MKKYEFDRRIFNRQWAFPFTVLQYAFAAGFILMVIAVILGAATDLHITVPTAFVVVLLISFVGFPIASVIKVGYRRLLQWSDLFGDGEIIVYDKLREKEWTAAGHLECRNVFTVCKVDSIRVSRCYLWITGRVQQTEIYNSRRAIEQQDILAVKIPRAYAGMEDLCGEAEQ